MASPRRDVEEEKKTSTTAAAATRGWKVGRRKQERKEKEWETERGGRWGRVGMIIGSDEEKGFPGEQGSVFF